MTNLIKHSGISESSAFQAAKEKYKKLTGPFAKDLKLPYSETTWIKGKGFVTYAEYECYNFKRMKINDKKYNTVYDVKKIKYDNSYDSGLYKFDKNDLDRTNRTWYEND